MSVPNAPAVTAPSAESVPAPASVALGVTEGASCPTQPSKARTVFSIPGLILGALAFLGTRVLFTQEMAGGHAVSLVAAGLAGATGYLVGQKIFGGG